MTEALMAVPATTLDDGETGESKPALRSSGSPVVPIELQSAGDGRLLLRIDGELVSVRLRQCFPWSEPSRFLSLSAAKDREVLLVDDPADLEPASRQALEQALALASFVLQVTRVLSIEEEVEIRQWRVLTKHGPRSFQTHLDDWPRSLPDGSLLVRDVAGDLYRLPPAEELDRETRATLWAFID